MNDTSINTTKFELYIDDLSLNQKYRHQMMLLNVHQYYILWESQV